MTERNEHKNEKYQNGYAIDLDEPEGFIKVGHIDGVINRRQSGMSFQIIQLKLWLEPTIQKAFCRI